MHTHGFDKHDIHGTYVSRLKSQFWQPLTHTNCPDEITTPHG